MVEGELHRHSASGFPADKGHGGQFVPVQGVGVGDLYLPSVGVAGVGFVGQGFVIADSDARVGAAASGRRQKCGGEDGPVPQVVERGSVAGGGVGEEQCQRGSCCEDAAKRGYPPAFVSKNTTERANAKGLVTKRLRTRFMTLFLLSVTSCFAGIIHRKCALMQYG